MSAWRRLVAAVSLVALLLAICLQGTALPDGLPAAFGLVLLPDDVPVVAGDSFTPCLEQPVALLALAAPRGPPLAARRG